MYRADSELQDTVQKMSPVSKQIIEEMRVRSQQVHVTIVDPRKAYDTVPIVRLGSPTEIEY